MLSKTLGHIINTTEALADNVLGFKKPVCIVKTTLLGLLSLLVVIFLPLLTLLTLIATSVHIVFPMEDITDDIFNTYSVKDTWSR